MDERATIGGLESTGITPSEAFAILGNETRMAILQALWERRAEPIAFSELRGAVGIDKGNFNYHLGELGHFVRRSDDGYELRETGKQVMRAVLAGVITEDPRLDPVEADRSCPFCGSAIELRYRDEHITVRCRNCASVLGGELPAGAFMHYVFPPAGLADRSLPEVLEAAHVLFEAQVATMLQGVCPECTGRAETTVTVCPDHELGPEGTCEACDSVPEIWARFACETCSFGRRSVLWLIALYHPATIAALYDRWELDSFLSLQRVFWSNPEYLASVSETVVAEDPLRLRVSFPTDGGTLALTFDEELRVLNVD